MRSEVVRPAVVSSWTAMVGMIRLPMMIQGKTPAGWCAAGKQGEPRDSIPGLWGSDRVAECRMDQGRVPWCHNEFPGGARMMDLGQSVTESQIRADRPTRTGSRK